MEKQSPFAAASKYGLVLALVMIIYSLVLNMLDMGTNQWAGWFNYIIILGGIIWGTIEYRDKVLKGSITYSGALGLGTLIVLFGAFVSATFMYVYITFIDQSIMSTMLLEAEKNLYTQGLDDETIEQSLAYMTPGIIALSTFLINVFVGFLLSLITAAILKRTPPEAV